MKRFGGKNSTPAAQRIEADGPTLGGTHPGGTTAPLGGRDAFSPGATSIRGKQVQQSKDITNLGGTAPGGSRAFVGDSAQRTSNTGYGGGDGSVSQVKHAAAMMHGGLADEAPDGRGNVPIHPGLRTGLYRTASDANPNVPDGQRPGTQQYNDAEANDGTSPRSPDNRNRGESPEIQKNPRGPYVAN